MKLLNSDEDVPEIFYVFVNELNPMTEHNFRVTKTFTSGAVNSCQFSPEFKKKYIEGTADYKPFQISKSDLVSPSPYFLSAINNYRIEYDAELYREHHHPVFPSRFSATYAFADLDTCKLVSQKYGWNLNNVRKFQLKDWPLTRVIKVNMEIVSLARHAYKVSMGGDPSGYWHSYWTSFGEIVVELPAPGGQRKRHNSGELWEYLIEGVLECVE